MNKEDRGFLKELQHEMLTQDTYSQADPRFWVISQKVKDYWVEDNIDGVCIFDNNACENIYEGLGSFEDIISTDWFKEFEGIEDISIGYSSIDFICNDTDYFFTDISELIDFINGEYSQNYNVCNYRERDEIVKDTMFLTLKECQEHLKHNKHHYNSSATPYSMTAWRSPQVERLYKIIQNNNWEN